MPTTVLIIDDHALVRTGMRLLLADAGDIQVAGEAATGEDGLAMARRLRPDVALCDLHRTAVGMKAGGVGYYAKSDFVHVDTGRVRYW